MFLIRDMKPKKIAFLRLCVKLELEEQRSHKVVTVMSIEFDLLLLVSLQWLLCSEVLNVFNYFLPLNTTDKSKIRSDRYIEFNISLYPLSFFANTPFKTQLMNLNS